MKQYATSAISWVIDLTGKIFNFMAASSALSVAAAFIIYSVYFEVRIKGTSFALTSGFFLRCAVIFLLVIVVSLIISFFFSNSAVKRLVRDIDKMGNDPDNIEKNCPYDELKPFAGRVQVQLDEKEKLLTMKKRFTANVSHELKTPLTSISGYGEMLQSNMVAPDDVAKIGGIICKESQRLINLTHDIIQLSQLEEYDYKPIIDFVDLLDVVNYCVEALSVKAQKKNVAVSVTGENCRVKGSKSLIEELVYNLVENAIKYNVENGRVDITIENTEKFVSLCVKDTGIGIPEKYQDRIFERFFRVDKSRSKATGGTGLGLAIVKHTAEYLGGSVKLESRENEGTAITVLLAK